MALAPGESRMLEVESCLSKPVLVSFGHRGPTLPERCEVGKPHGPAASAVAPLPYRAVIVTDLGDPPGAELEHLDADGLDRDTVSRPGSVERRLGDTAPAGA